MTQTASPSSPYTISVAFESAGVALLNNLEHVSRDRLAQLAHLHGTQQAERAERDAARAAMQALIAAAGGHSRYTSQVSFLHEQARDVVKALSYGIDPVEEDAGDVYVDLLIAVTQVLDAIAFAPLLTPEQYGALVADWNRAVGEELAL